MKLSPFIYFICCGLLALSSCVSLQKSQQVQKEIEFYQQSTTKLQKDSLFLVQQKQNLLSLLTEAKNKNQELSPEDTYLLSLLDEQKQQVAQLEKDLRNVFIDFAPEEVLIQQKGGAVSISLEAGFLMDAQQKLTPKARRALDLLAFVLVQDDPLHIVVKAASFWQANTPLAHLIVEELSAKQPLLGQRMVSASVAGRFNRPTEIVLAYPQPELHNALKRNTEGSFLSSR